MRRPTGLGLIVASVLATAGCLEVDDHARASSDAGATADVLSGNWSDSGTISDATGDPEASASCLGTGTSATLVSTCVSTGSFQAYYFDVVAKAPIVLTGFDVFSQLCGLQDVTVYYRNGTYAGAEKDEAEWHLVGSVQALTPNCGATCDTPIAPTPLPIPICLALSAQERRAFYIVITAGDASFESNNNLKSGDQVVEDGHVKLYAGRGQLGVGAFKGTLADDRAWQGVLRYQY